MQHNALFIKSISLAPLAIMGQYVFLHLFLNASSFVSLFKRSGGPCPCLYINFSPYHQVQDQVQVNTYEKNNNNNNDDNNNNKQSKQNKKLNFKMFTYHPSVCRLVPEQGQKFFRNSRINSLKDLCQQNCLGNSCNCFRNFYTTKSYGETEFMYSCKIPLGGYMDSHTFSHEFLSLLNANIHD